VFGSESENKKIESKLGGNLEGSFNRKRPVGLKQVVK